MGLVVVCSDKWISNIAMEYFRENESCRNCSYGAQIESFRHSIHLSGFIEYLYGTVTIGTYVYSILLHLLQTWHVQFVCRLSDCVWDSVAFYIFSLINPTSCCDQIPGGWIMEINSVRQLNQGLVHGATGLNSVRQLNQGWVWQQQE